MQTREFAVAAVGTQRMVNSSLPIRAARIDNPSGMWLNVVEATSPFIPPNTLAWITNFDPVVNTIHVQYVDAAVGGLASTVTGGPIVVTTYETPQIPSNGIAYTAASTADIAGVNTRLDLNNVKLDSVIANTGIGGTLETDLAKIVQNTGHLNTPIWQSINLTAAGLVVINPLPPGSQLLSSLLVVFNPKASPEAIWYADTSWGLANSVRSNGFSIEPGGYAGFVLLGDSIEFTTTSVNVTVRKMQAYLV
jgi:hypothetical protein